jgi:beta-lactamase regulating signal transducer with metallopeptidase domain
MPAPVNQTRASASTPAPVKPSFRWASVQALVWATIFLAWVAGVFVALIRLWQQLAGLRQLRANAQPISPSKLNCADCQPELLTAKAGLGLSAEINSPVLIGARRPMILLPADIADWTTDDERRAMLQHELAHVERHDHWTNLLPTMLDVIFFFHPLVRYACRQLSLEMEMACDDRVVSLGAGAEAYAESILKVAERGITQSWTPSGAHQLALFSAKHILERRIEMIMNKDRCCRLAANSRWFCQAWAGTTARRHHREQISDREIPGRQQSLQLFDRDGAAKPRCTIAAVGSHPADRNRR